MAADALRSMLDGLRVAHAANEQLTSEDGKTYIDLFCGSGTVLLGHSNPAILAGLQEQLGRVWNTGILATRVRAEAQAQIESFFPSTHGLACLYSTGMEAAEFAMRVARGTTGRGALVGFDRHHHGKSLAAASLGWTTPYVTAPEVLRLPGPPDCPEDEILDRLARALAKKSVAAVFIEPLLGSGGGYASSPAYHRTVSQLCAEHGTLLVFDEILTGFHRTGAPFMFESLGVMPDIVLIGKAMGNGFPVSGVIVDRRHAIIPPMLPGSTYAGNPLAAAVIAATLKQIRSLPLESMVNLIGATIESELQSVGDAGIALRGRGAIWVLEFPSEAGARMVAGRAMAGGVVASSAGRWLRLLPPATIPLARLTQACTVIREACLA